MKRTKRKRVKSTRARILLESADGKTDADISQWLYVSESTVRRIRLRFCEAGIGAALV